MASLRNRFQVNLPFDRIGQYGRFFLDKGLHPEIGLSGPVVDDTDEKEFRVWAEAFAQRRVTVHAPFLDLCPGGMDPRMVRVTRERLCRAARIAGLLGATTMVCHAGYEFRRYPHNLDRWVETSVRTWAEVLEAGENTGLKVLLENVYEREPEPICRVLEEINLPRLGACFDTGHFNTWSRMPLDQWLEALGPWLDRLHLHDNDGSFDQHLPIGQGNFDFQGLMARLTQKGLSPGITLEPHSLEDFVLTFKAFRELITENGKPF